LPIQSEQASRVKTQLLVIPDNADAGAAIKGGDDFGNIDLRSFVHHD
jgi:hypothetical protein